MSRPLADAHFHLFSRGMPATRGGRVLGGASEIAVYESYRKAFGIAAGLAIGYEADGIDPHNNQYIRSLAAERPWLATIAHAAAVPAFQPASASAFLDDGHLGIAIYALDSAGGASVAAWPTETWRVLGARRAIISLNARNQSTATLAPLVERETSCTFLFSHLGLPGRVSVPPTIVQAAERLGPLLRLADMPHVLVKISGLYAVSESQRTPIRTMRRHRSSMSCSPGSARHAAFGALISVRRWNTCRLLRRSRIRGLTACPKKSAIR